MRVCARSLVGLLTTLFVSVAGALPAAGGDSRRSAKLDKVLQEALAHPPKTMRVIITTRPGSESTLEATLRGHGDVIEREHASLNAFTATVHGEDLAALAADPSVLGISIDAWVTSFGRAPASTVPPPINVLRTTLGLNGSVVSGTGIKVAVVDSGIAPVLDLFANIDGFRDFTRGAGPDGMAMRPYDDYGHGTHVAGLIASNGRVSSLQFTGIAPNVRLYGFKVLDTNGRGRTSDVVDAITYIVRHNATLGIDIINLSLGHPIFEPAGTDPLVAAVEQAARAGIVVVAAAGNVGLDSEGHAGYSGIMSPGNAPSAITVGAVDTERTAAHSDDRVAYFSSRGPTWFDAFSKPDIVAPGVALTSDASRYATLYATYPQLKTTAANGNMNFATLSGTSVATAVATGVVALVLDANTPDNVPYSHTLTPNAVKAVLQYTALPVRNDAGVPYDVLTQGTGEINAPGAVAMAAAIDPGAPLHQPWGTPLEPLTTIGGETVSWSQALVWDENMVWGTNIVWSNSVLWDENIVWGTTDDENIVWGRSAGCDPAINPDCENIVWGTAADVENVVWGTYLSCDPSVTPDACENIVWGTNIVWATNIVWGNRVVGFMADDENIVWGTAEGLTEENIVWGTSADGENIVWGTFAGGSFTWGAADDGENIVWGSTTACDPAIDSMCENVVWGTALQPNGGGGGGENIVWGTKRRR